MAQVVYTIFGGPGGAPFDVHAVAPGAAAAALSPFLAPLLSASGVAGLPPPDAVHTITSAHISLALAATASSQPAAVALLRRWCVDATPLTVTAFVGCASPFLVGGFAPGPPATWTVEAFVGGKMGVANAVAATLVAHATYPSKAAPVLLQQPAQEWHFGIVAEGGVNVRHLPLALQIAHVAGMESEDVRALLVRAGGAVPPAGAPRRALVEAAVALLRAIDSSNGGGGTSGGGGGGGGGGRAAPVASSTVDLTTPPAHDDSSIAVAGVFTASQAMPVAAPKAGRLTNVPFSVAHRAALGVHRLGLGGATTVDLSSGPRVDLVHINAALPHNAAFAALLRTVEGGAAFADWLLGGSVGLKMMLDALVAAHAAGTSIARGSARSALPATLFATGTGMAQPRSALSDNAVPLTLDSPAAVLDAVAHTLLCVAAVCDSVQAASVGPAVYATLPSCEQQVRLLHAALRPAFAGLAGCPTEPVLRLLLDALNLGAAAAAREVYDIVLRAGDVRVVDKALLVVAQNFKIDGSLLSGLDNIYTSSSKNGVGHPAQAMPGGPPPVVLPPSHSAGMAR